MLRTRPTDSRTENVPFGARVVPSTCACETVRGGDCCAGRETAFGESALLAEAAAGFACRGDGLDEEEAALPASATRGEEFSARSRFRSATIMPVYEVFVFVLLAIDCSSSRAYTRGAGIARTTSLLARRVDGGRGEAVRLF